MPKKPEISQDPGNPNKLVLVSYPYTSRYLIKRDEYGNICEPWVTEESTSIDAHSMDYQDHMALLKHREWALPFAREEAKRMAQKKLL